MKIPLCLLAAFCMLISSCQKEGGKEKELSEKVILGKWCYKGDPTEGYLDFLSDNTYIGNNGDGTQEIGKWTLLDDGRLKIESSSRTYAWEIKIEGDNAVILIDGVKMFFRAK